MHEGRAADQWKHTSLLAALIANANRDPKKRPAPFQPRDFDPYAPKEKRLVVGIGALRDLFVQPPATPPN